VRSLLLRILLASWLAACALGMAGAAPAWLYASESLDQVQLLLEWVAIAAFLGLLALSCLGLLLDLVVLLYALYLREAAPLKWLVPWSLPLLLLAGTIGAVWISPWGVWRARGAAFRALAERSERLTVAIDCYWLDQGHVPPTLEALVPRYLLSVPDTGIARYPRYCYSVFEGGIRGARMLWYDLGRPAGESDECFHYYFVGARQGCAMLVVVVDGAGSIVGTDTDSVDGEANQHSFDAALWKAEPKQRASMVEDLRRSLEGRSVDDLRSLLGPEDGAEDLQPHYWGTPFELTVHCSIGVLNWDEFVYWPLEEYPDHMMGGWVERIGGWAYVHE